MTFGVRPSCVATLRCGSSLARLEMQCLHQERNTHVREFRFVQFICSGSRWRFSCSLQLGCLRCLAQQDLQMLVFLVFSLLSIAGLPAICSTCSNWLFTSQRHHSLHLLRVGSRKIHPERSILPFQFDTPSWFQWRLVTNPSTLWRKYHCHSSVVH